MAKINKVIPGFVVQSYVDGKCVGQEFIAGSEVDYEDEEGNPVDGPTEEEYCPMLMAQPSDGRPIIAITVMEFISWNLQEVITYPATEDGAKGAEATFLSAVKCAADYFEQTLSEDDIAGIMSDGEYTVGSKTILLVHS